MNQLHRGWRSSAAFRFTVYTFLIVFAILGLFLVLDSRALYHQEIERKNYQLQLIRESYLASITIHLWQTDYQVLESILELVVQFPFVERAEIEEDDKVVVFAGTLPNNGAYRIHSQQLVHLLRGEALELGWLHVHVDQAALRARVISDVLRKNLNNVLAALLVAAAVALVFRYQIGRHLQRLAEYAADEDQSVVHQEITLPRCHKLTDELTVLVDSINRMRRNIHDYYAQREILIGEIHHRVKNDMSFIISLLELQAETTDNVDAKYAISEAVQRLTVMVRVYQRLYAGDNFQQVNLKPLIEQMVREFSEYLDVFNGEIDSDIESCIVASRVSVAIGVIINELLTNAAKYGDGRIMVSLTCKKDRGGLDLLVRDSGPGFPAETIAGDKTGYGFMVVNALVEQYNGLIRLYNEHGAVVEIFLQLDCCEAKA